MAPSTTSHRCTVEGCPGWLRPETDGMGNLRMACDECEKRRQRPGDLSAYLFSVERRLRALEARFDGFGRATPPVAPQPAPRTAPAPAASTLRAPLRGMHRSYGGRPTLTSRIIAVLAASDTPLLIDEIQTAIRRADASANVATVKGACYQLALKGQIVSTERDRTKRGRPVRYQLAPASIGATSPTLDPHPAP